MARRYRTRSEGAYGYRSGGYRRRERRSEERTVEMVSFGLIIVLFAVMLLYPKISPATIALIGGLILVGSAVFQWQRRWRVNPATWIGGVIMLVAGFLGLQGQPMPLGIYLPLLVFGIVIVASFLTGEF